MPANNLLLTFPGATGSRYKSFSTDCKLRARRSSSFSSSRAARKAESAECPSARSSSYRSSRCCAISSAISPSRAGDSFNGARRRRISGFQSGIFCLGDAIDAGYKFLPAAKLRSEDFAALARQTIVTATALPVFFNPASTQPATAFKTVEQRVERGDVKTHIAARALLDKFADFVAVARTGFDERKNEEFGATFFPFYLRGYLVHIWHRNILESCAA